MKWLALAALLALAAAPAAIGAGPAFQDRNTFEVADPDFCGTGETVLVEGKEVVNGWVGTTGDDPTQVVKLTVSLLITFTNPDNGNAVVEHWAFRGTNEIVEGVEGGPHTHMFVENGLKATLKLANGRLLTRGAGSLAYAISFDEDDNVTGLEIVWMRGPHPSFPEGDFCGVVVPALGLD